MLQNYLDKRPNLICTFILVDSRLEPQKNDIEFINWMGLQNLPLAIVFTKSDKLSALKTNANVENFKKELLKYWDDLPALFITSSEKGQGKESILNYISENMGHFSPENA